MIGVFTTLGLAGTVTVLCLWPPRPRHSSPVNLTFLATHIINEQPYLGLLWLASGTVEPLTSRADQAGAGWWLAAVSTTLVAVGLVANAARARTAHPTLLAALRDATGDTAFQVPRSPRPWLRILVLPFISWRPDVRRVRNRAYGPHRLQRLDVYAARRRRGPAPVFVYFHGGAFRTGGKILGAHPLLHLMASRGWVCITANYRLQPRVTHADQVDDARSVLQWVTEHGAAFGADPTQVVIGGGSAGANLAAMAADQETGMARLPRLAGFVGLYGYYGRGGSPRSVVDALGPAAPPVFIIHGGHDTLVIPSDARDFAARLRDRSRNPVAYAELPYTQHNFDFFHSVRCHALNDAVLAFAKWAIDSQRSA